MTDPLPSWNDGDPKTDINAFVRAVVGEDGVAGVPVADRVAVFDNNGTLWCEKPMPIQLDFILRRLVAMAEQEPGLRARQPWKAACERDYGWLSAVVVEHHAGDDINVRVLAAGILAAFEGVTVDDFEARAGAFLRGTDHPTLGRGYLECAYAPMVELLGYLADNGFTNYIATGGGRDFMRPVSDELYGIPRERVIGSTAALAYTPDEHGGTITHQAAADYLDDGPEKPSGSGAARGGGRSWPRATPTATFPCSTTRGIRLAPAFVCSCATTTRSVSSTTRPARNRHCPWQKNVSGRS